MELFPFVESGAPVLVSASENGLFLHPIHNERFGHPFLLCSGYKNGFSGCVYNGSLYYTYINKENSLLLRRLHESTTLFRLDGTDTVTYQAPQPVAFQGSLLLFYSEKSKDAYRLKLHLPFSDREPKLPDIFGQAYSAPPLLSLQATGHYLYLFLTTDNTVSAYRYSSAGFETLSSEEELLSRLLIPWEAEKTQLEQALLRAVHLSEQQQNLLTAKEQNLQTVEATLKECEQSREQALQKLKQTTLLLERAKKQYNELMQVAEQYRQEAAKWYGKFTDRV
ncbi:MAG: hypothetical protein E7268_05460 [Lachnospiraceae bacterium]|nr:hypothetical protein [Lachnospiraceae bacterium]